MIRCPLLYCAVVTDVTISWKTQGDTKVYFSHVA